MWGFQDGIVNIHTFQILGFEFTNSSDPFSVFNLVRAIAVLLFEIIQADFDEKDSDWTYKSQLIIYTLIVGVLGFCCLLSSYFLDFKTPQVNQKINKNNITQEVEDIRMTNLSSHDERQNKVTKKRQKMIVAHQLKMMNSANVIMD